MTTPSEAGCACGWHGDADAADDHPCTLPDPTSPTLVEFLLARIAEDENDAEHAVEAEGANWEWDGSPTGNVGASSDSLACDLYSDVGAHVARWDPARVLTECNTKRQLIELLTEPRYCDAFPRCSSSDEEEEMRALRILALPFADHPDYQQAWRL